MGKKIKNDQGELIQAIKDGNRSKAWMTVRFIGFKIQPDINERFLIFNKAFDKFDPYKNNNFIHFFMAQIKFDTMREEDRKLCIVTNNRNIINAVKYQQASPKDDLPELTKEVLKFYD